MLAVNTNVLVYAHRREVTEHLVAERLVRNMAEGSVPWAIPWPCLYEFFSVVTSTRIWKAAATPPRAAWAQIDGWLGSPSLRLLSEIEGFESVLAPLLQKPRVRGPVVHDARIAALCLAHGVEALLTRDRDFSLFGELELRNPFGG